MNYKLLAYAMDFASFLIQKITIQGAIRNIILYGSVTRGESGKRSDVDVFVDTLSEGKDMEKDIRKSYELFRASAKYKHYWKLLGVENDITIHIGDINKWKGLHSSILANGIVLYGKYKSLSQQGVHKTIFVWENIKPNSKRVLFNKQLFGYTQNKKQYLGLLQKCKGERLGKGCIIVDLDYANVLHAFFKKNKITVKIKKFLEY